MDFDYVEKIMASPDVPQQIDALYEAMQAEKKRRHDFREWITPGIKAEFINGEIILHSPVKKRHFSVTDLLLRLLSFYGSIKKQDYAAHGIREYWIIDPIRQSIKQYILLSPKDKEYLPAKTFGLADEIESPVIKGFIIPVQAIFDEAVNVETLQDLLQS